MPGACAIETESSVGPAAPVRGRRRHVSACFDALACGALVSFVLGLGCAGAEVIPPAPPAAPSSTKPVQPSHPYRPGEMPVTVGDEPDDAVEVDLEHGYLNQGQVDDVLAANNRRLSACYQRAGRAQLYAHGEVKLRFQLAASGQVNDVLVIDNELGNYAVERCLVTEGQKIQFPRPGGNKQADFDYSMDFRSPRQKYVVVWRRDTLRRPIAARMRSLGRCGSPGEQAVQAVAYIRPSGAVASVGLSSQGPLEVGAARCVVGQIMKWRLRGDRGHLVRTSFPVSAGGAPAPASSSAPAPTASGAVGLTARLKRTVARRSRHD